MHWLLPSLNSTFIALVPKGEESNTLDKFRPISLCNFIYKLISKVVENRLKPLLPLLILPEQTRYVEGRQITDGIILSNEVIHSLKILKELGMIMKLDLSKAFDKLITSPCFSVLHLFPSVHREAYIKGTPYPLSFLFSWRKDSAASFTMLFPLKRSKA